MSVNFSVLSTDLWDRMIRENHITNELLTCIFACGYFSILSLDLLDHMIRENGWNNELLYFRVFIFHCIFVFIF